MDQNDEKETRRYRQRNLLNDEVSPQAYFLMAVTMAFSVASLKQNAANQNKKKTILPTPSAPKKGRSWLRIIFLVTIVMLLVMLVCGYLFL